MTLNTQKDRIQGLLQDGTGSRNPNTTPCNPLILEIDMDQKLLDEQYSLLNTLSVIRSHGNSGHFDIPSLINELQKFAISLSDYFSMETDHIKSILNSPDCSEEVTESGRELFVETDLITKKLADFVSDYWGSKASERDFYKFQVALSNQLNDIEIRLNGAKGSDSPFFHLKNPLC